MDTLKVLVTDDEMGMRLGVTRTLRDFSVRVPDVNGAVAFTVDQAESGEEALEKIDRSPPDILLLGSQDAGHQRAGSARSPGRPRDRHADDHDHGLRLDRDGRGRDQTRGLRFPRQAVHARRAQEHDSQGGRAADPGQAGPAARRGETPRPLRVHPRAGPRAQGPAECRGRLPRHPAEPSTGRQPGRLRRTGRPQPRRAWTACGS